MKRTVRVKLLPNPEQRAALLSTLAACNAAADRISVVARDRKVFDKHHLQRLIYAEERHRLGGSQATVRTIAKVAEAYAAHRGNLRAGNCGKKGTTRRTAAEATVIRFRPGGAQPYDDRILSWNHQNRTVSIWSTAGRLKSIPYTGRAEDLEVLAAHRKGESDLVPAGGDLFLAATIDLPAPAVTSPAGFLGVDLGIVQIASVATEAGDAVMDWSGGAVTAKRKRNQKLRSKLQKKGTKSAKRLLRKRSRKESRFVADVNHRVSKTIVAEAQRTGRGIAVEDLTGIRDRVRHRKPQRATLHSWTFALIGIFLAYKAEAAGIAFIQIDPAHTSQQCSACGAVDRKSRASQSAYQCTSCGVSLNADTNAAINIARRGVEGWAAANRPHAA